MGSIWLRRVGSKPPAESWQLEQVTGWRPEPEMTVEGQRGEQWGGWEPPRAREGGSREAGRLDCFSPLPLPRKGDEGSEETDPEINPRVSSADGHMLSPMTFVTFSLETKEQTNKIRFHPPSGSILMSLYLCDMVSLSPFASGKGSWCSWHHTACIFKVSGSCWQQPTDPPASQTKHTVWKGLSQCWFSGLYSGKLEMGKKAWKEALIPISEGRCFP